MTRTPPTLRQRRELANLTIVQAATLVVPPVHPDTWRHWEMDGLTPAKALEALNRASEAPPRGSKARTNGRHKRQVVLGDEAVAILDAQPKLTRSTWIESLILAAKPSA